MLRRSSGAKRRTGVKEVDIAGAYKGDMGQEFTTTPRLGADADGDKTDFDAEIAALMEAEGISVGDGFAKRKRNSGKKSATASGTAMCSHLVELEGSYATTTKRSQTCVPPSRSQQAAPLIRKRQISIVTSVDESNPPDIAPAEVPSVPKQMKSGTVKGAGSTRAYVSSSQPTDQRHSSPHPACPTEGKAVEAVSVQGEEEAIPAGGLDNVAQVQRTSQEQTEASKVDVTPIAVAVRQSRAAALQAPKKLQLVSPGHQPATVPKPAKKKKKVGVFVPDEHDDLAAEALKTTGKGGSSLPKQKVVLLTEPIEKQQQGKEKKPGAPRGRTAYFFFLGEMREKVKAEDPSLSITDIARKVGQLWRELPEEEKAIYLAMAEEDRIRVKEQGAKKDPVKERVTPEGDQGGVVQLKKKEVRKRTKGSRKKKDMVAPDDHDGAGGHGVTLSVGDEAAAALDDIDGATSDREDVDWTQGPAEVILSHTNDGKYLVKRQGMSIVEYGKVDTRVAKRQRLGDEQSDNLSGSPVDLRMVEEYEVYCRKFWSSVHEHTIGGSLDLDDLEEGSPLEMCYYLGKLQEEHHLLSKRSIAGNKRTHPDIVIRVPALALSLTVQRLLDLERRRAEEALKKVQALEEQLRTAGAGLDVIMESQEELTNVSEANK